MTVVSSLSRISYTTNSITTAFPTTFQFLEETDLVVTLVGSTGVESLQALTTDYTTSGGSGDVGTVNMNVAPNDVVLVIERDTPVTQNLDLEFGSRLPSESLERALDKLTMNVQRTRDLLDFPINALGDSYNAQGRKITNVATASSAADAVIKAQLDAAVIAAGNVPTPDNPGDDGGVLTASGGTFDWVVSPTLNGVRTGSADLGMSSLDQNGLINLAVGSITYSLLSASSVEAGFSTTIRKTAGDTNDVAVLPMSGQTIDVFSSFVLRYPGDEITAISDGSNWQVAGKQLAPIETYFTSAGTASFAPVLGRRVFDVEVVGAGAGGGGAPGAGSGNANGGGGGSGAYAKVRLSDLTSEIVTVGAGGTGGSFGTGGAGEASLFGSHVTANGGSGGSGGTNTTGNAEALGGVGGTEPSSGDIKIAGGSGNLGTVISGFRISNGQGGAAPGVYGGSTNSDDGLGTNAVGFGNGGSGAGASTVSRAGGSGADGLVKVVQR